MYKLITQDSDVIPVNMISIQEPGRTRFINLDVESSWKEQYLAWLAEGNEPLPADEPE